jgi:hypothetical protein
MYVSPANLAEKVLSVRVEDVICYWIEGSARMANWFGRVTNGSTDWQLANGDLQWN